MASKAIQIRNALQTAIQGITAAWCTTNGYSAKIVLPANCAVVGNFVGPSDKDDFPYVHVGTPKTDYRGADDSTSGQYPFVNLDIYGFVRDSDDCEAVADELAQAICQIITADNTLGGLSIDVFYLEVESFEAGEDGLGMTHITTAVRTFHDYGDLDG